MREWHDPSTWLSASAAAAGLMLAGEGNGRADKVWAPTESIEPTALHLSLEGGWRGVVHGIKGTIMLGRQEMKKALKDRDFDKKIFHIDGFWPQLGFRLTLSPGYMLK